MTLSEKDIAKILELSDKGLSDYKISKEMGVSRSTVRSYLENPRLFTQPQNLHTDEHIPTPNEINTIPLEKLGLMKNMMAPQLYRKLSSLGIIDSEDLRCNLKTLYPLLNSMEKYMLRIYLNKCVINADKLVKEAMRELIETGKIELDRLYDEVESGKISENFYESESENILMEIEAEFSVD